MNEPKYEGKGIYWPTEKALDLICCPPGECEHAACEARYLKRLGLRRYPKDPLEDRWPE